MSTMNTQLLENTKPVIHVNKAAINQEDFKEFIDQNTLTFDQQKELYHAISTISNSKYAKQGCDTDIDIAGINVTLKITK